LLSVALREFLFITRNQLFLEVLTSGHSARLVATGAAEEWLETRLAETRKFLATVHREPATQELLDTIDGELLYDIEIAEDGTLLHKILEQEEDEDDSRNDDGSDD
jgi:hypothetical protein